MLSKLSITESRIHSLTAIQVSSINFFGKLTLNSEDRSKATLASNTSLAGSSRSRTAISHYRARHVKSAFADEEARTSSKLGELIRNRKHRTRHPRADLTFKIQTRTAGCSSQSIYLGSIVWSTSGSGWSNSFSGKIGIYNTVEENTGGCATATDTRNCGKIMCNKKLMARYLMHDFRYRRNKKI